METVHVLILVDTPTLGIDIYQRRSTPDIECKLEEEHT
jgi:hypothetical protein